MTQDEHNEARLEGLERALEIVRRYQDVNWRKLRATDICTDIKRVINDEVARIAALGNSRW
jgi:hypothetical protein